MLIKAYGTYLCVRGPTMGFVNNWTKALDANIIPTATVSSSNSRCLISFWGNIVDRLSVGTVEPWIFEHNQHHTIKRLYLTLILIDDWVNYQVMQVLRYWTHWVETGDPWWMNRSEDTCIFLVLLVSWVMWEQVWELWVRGPVDLFRWDDWCRKEIPG